MTCKAKYKRTSISRLRAFKFSMYEIERTKVKVVIKLLAIVTGGNLFMSEQAVAPRRESPPKALSLSAPQIVVRLMLRCPQCKQRSLAVGKSTGDMHLCPSCGARFVM